MIGPGAEVSVRHGQLMIWLLSPIPTLARGFVLHPDDQDPYVFASRRSYPGAARACPFPPETRELGTTAVHIASHLLSFQKQPAADQPRVRPL